MTKLLSVMTGWGAYEHVYCDEFTEEFLLVTMIVLCWDGACVTIVLCAVLLFKDVAI